MIQRTTQPRSRCAPLTARLVLVALAGAIVASCGGDDHHGGHTPTAVPATGTATARSPSAATSTPAATRTATPPSASAGTACTKLAGCNQCMTNFYGACLSTGDCAARLSADAAVCINGVTGCDPSTLGNCLFLGCDGADASGECQ